MSESSQDGSRGGSKPLKQQFVSPKARARAALLRLNSDGEASSSLPAVPENAPRDQATSPAPPMHARTAGILTSENTADDARHHFEYPSAGYLVGLQIGMSLGYCAYMLTSWLYCAIQHQVLFPKCSILWGGIGSWTAWGCIAASLIFWTFPLFCCIVFLLYMYRDLLHTRLYYEMFAHRVHLDFMNIGFFQAPMVICMLVWMVLCLAFYPMTSALSVRGFLVTLPFWIPVISFGAMLYTQWDLETRLLSVAKFVEGDVEWANDHMHASFFLRDYVAEAALHNVIKKLEKQKPPPKLTMGQYIMMIAEEADQMAAAGESPDEKLASKMLISSWSPRYWVKLIVYSEYLEDAEAKKFIWWFYFYKAFTVLMITVLLFLCFLTVVSYLHQQGVIPSSTLTEWVNLDYLAIVSYNPGSVPGTSQANAIGTVTSGGFQYIRNFDRMGQGKEASIPLPHHPYYGPFNETHYKTTSGTGVPSRNPTEKEQNTEKKAETRKTNEKAASMPPSYRKNSTVTPEPPSKTPSRRQSSNDKRKDIKKNLVDRLLSRFPARRISPKQKVQSTLTPLRTAL